MQRSTALLRIACSSKSAAVLTVSVGGRLLSTGLRSAIPSAIFFLIAPEVEFLVALSGTPISWTAEEEARSNAFRLLNPVPLIPVGPCGVWLLPYIVLLGDVNA